MQAPDANKFAQALAAFQAGRFGEAENLCRALLKEKTDHAAAMHLLGAIEEQRGNKDEAERLMGRSIALQPGFAEMHTGYGRILSSQGKYDEGVEQFQKALAIKPDHPLAKAGLASALNNLGVMQFEAGHFAEAVDYAQRALELRPDHAAFLTNLGNALKEVGEWKKAIQCYRAALERELQLDQARNNLGLTLLYGARDAAGAKSCFRDILTRHPDYVPALTHLGIVRCVQGDYGEGLKCYEKALTAQPNYRDALNNRANALRALGRLDEAIADYKKVVAAKPEDAEGHNNLAAALLEAGRFDEGWKENEWRWQTAQLRKARRDFAQPQWRGGGGKGRALLIHAEQGFGDTLQFCRYAPLAVARGWRVVLEVQPELGRLMRSLAEVERVIARGEILPDFDVHCPMMSLPLAFGDGAIPNTAPYLAADEADIRIWRDRLATDKGFKVGLVWTGNPRLFSFDFAAANIRRSVPVEMLATLGGITGVTFYNLQKGAVEFPAGLEIVDFMPECRDFADTAALVANLDLVISVDTSVAHLAGALGKPVWLLNRHDTCWRWLRGRDDSPWYPTLRQFRQSRPGDWAGVVDAVRVELAKIA